MFMSMSVAVAVAVVVVVVVVVTVSDRCNNTKVKFGAGLFWERDK